MEYLIFVYDPERESMSTAPQGGAVPFGVVHCYYGPISICGLAFDQALTFGFDFNQLGLGCVIALAVRDKEVGHIHALLASDGIAIGYADAFAGPLYYVFVVVQEHHECEFPTTAILGLAFAHILVWIAYGINALAEVWHG